MSQQPPSPFLNIDQRIQYLYDREYVKSECITPASKRRLAQMNFHYFLGYARNYRMIAGSTNLVASKDIADIFHIIDIDHQVSDLMISALRSAEHYLRSTLVQEYCRAGLSPESSFLNTQTYTDLGEDSSPERLVETIADQVLRYREPYVSDHIASRAQELGMAVPKRSRDDSRCLGLLDQLPIWSVVDCLQLGTLSRIISQAKTPDGPELWRKVAKATDIRAQIFPTNLKSLSTFRNQVAHFNRLWMKPTADTPKKPNTYEKRLRDFSPTPKSMLLNFYNIGLFLPNATSNRFLDEVDAILTKSDNSLYRLGVTDPMLEKLKK